MTKFQYTFKHFITVTILMVSLLTCTIYMLPYARGAKLGDNNATQPEDLHSSAFIANQTGDETVETAQTEAIQFSVLEDKNATPGKIGTQSQLEVIEELNQMVRAGMFTMHANLEPVFENGYAKGNLLIVNETSNTHPQIVEIYLKESDRLIYQSDSLGVGEKIAEAALDRPLAAGKYDCIAYFTSIDEDTDRLLGRAGAEMTITVLK